MAATLAWFLGWYRYLKQVVPVLPLIALLFPTRSLNSYFVYAIPALLVSLATVSPAVRAAIPSEPIRRGVQILGVVLVAGAASMLTLALASPSPIVLQPVDHHTTGALQSVDSLTVLARNTTGHPLEPHFTVALGPYMSSYWIVREGPAILEPGTSGRYVLVAPNTPSMPAVDQESVVYAMTADPASISSARLFPAVDERTLISPQAINQEVPSGKVTMTVQLVDRINAPIERAGVPISLGQVLYTEEGLYPGLTSINRHPEGQSPVVAYTDSRGIARFRIRAVQQQPYEVFFQAWIADKFPHGYSVPVAVHFRIDEKP
jgi:hypothetical protein